MFELAMVNESSVYELLSIDSISDIATVPPYLVIVLLSIPREGGAL